VNTLSSFNCDTTGLGYKEEMKNRLKGHFIIKKFVLSIWTIRLFVRTTFTFVDVREGQGEGSCEKFVKKIEDPLDFLTIPNTPLKRISQTP
jgi:hypothetical protein